MIIGIGIDICLVSRINKVLNIYGDRFKERCFTQAERIKCESVKNSSACYAKRFAAKEAVSKALGTGIRNGVYWKSIEIINEKSGKPKVELHDGAKKTLSSLLYNNMLPKIHISITDENELAQAYVVIDAIKKETK